MSKTFPKKIYPSEKNVVMSNIIPDTFIDNIRTITNAGDYGKLEELLTNYPVNLNFTENKLNTSLLHSVIRSTITNTQKLRLVKLLIKYGIPINNLDDKGLPPLYYAIQLQLYDIFSILIEKTNNLNNLPNNYDYFRLALSPNVVNCAPQLFNQNESYMGKYYSQQLNIERDFRQYINDQDITKKVIKYILEFSKRLPDQVLTYVDMSDHSIKTTDNVKLLGTPEENLFPPFDNKIKKILDTVTDTIKANLYKGSYNQDQLITAKIELVSKTLSELKSVLNTNSIKETIKLKQSFEYNSSDAIDDVYNKFVESENSDLEQLINNYNNIIPQIKADMLSFKGDIDSKLTDIINIESSLMAEYPIFKQNASEIPELVISKKNQNILIDKLEQRLLYDVNDNIDLPDITTQINEFRGGYNQKGGVIINKLDSIIKVFDDNLKKKTVAVGGARPSDVSDNVLNTNVNLELEGIFGEPLLTLPLAQDKLIRDSDTRAINGMITTYLTNINPANNTFNTPANRGRLNNYIRTNINNVQYVDQVNTGAIVNQIILPVINNPNPGILNNLINDTIIFVRYCIAFLMTPVAIRNTIINGSTVVVNTYNTFNNNLPNVLYFNAPLFNNIILNAWIPINNNLLTKLSENRSRIDSIRSSLSKFKTTLDIAIKNGSSINKLLNETVHNDTELRKAIEQYNKNINILDSIFCDIYNKTHYDSVNKSRPFYGFYNNLLKYLNDVINNINNNRLRKINIAYHIRTAGGQPPAPPAPTNIIFVIHDEIQRINSFSNAIKDAKDNALAIANTELGLITAAAARAAPAAPAPPPITQLDNIMEILIIAARTVQAPVPAAAVAAAAAAAYQTLVDQATLLALESIRGNSAAALAIAQVLPGIPAALGLNPRNYVCNGAIIGATASLSEDILKIDAENTTGINIKKGFTEQRIITNAKSRIEYILRLGAISGGIVAKIATRGGAPVALAGAINAVSAILPAIQGISIALYMVSKSFKVQDVDRLNGLITPLILAPAGAFERDIANTYADIITRKITTELGGTIEEVNEATIAARTAAGVVHTVAVTTVESITTAGIVAGISMLVLLRSKVPINKAKSISASAAASAAAAAALVAPAGAVAAVLLWPVNISAACAGAISMILEISSNVKVQEDIIDSAQINSKFNSRHIYSEKITKIFNIIIQEVEQIPEYNKDNKDIISIINSVRKTFYLSNSLISYINMCINESHLFKEFSNNFSDLAEFNKIIIPSDTNISTQLTIKNTLRSKINELGEYVSNKMNFISVNIKELNKFIVEINNITEGSLLKNKFGNNNELLFNDLFMLYKQPETNEISYNNNVLSLYSKQKALTLHNNDPADGKLQYKLPIFESKCKTNNNKKNMAILFGKSYAVTLPMLSDPAVIENVVNVILNMTTFDEKMSVNQLIKSVSSVIMADATAAAAAPAPAAAAAPAPAAPAAPAPAAPAAPAPAAPAPIPLQPQVIPLLQKIYVLQPNPLPLNPLQSIIDSIKETITSSKKKIGSLIGETYYTDTYQAIKGRIDAIMQNALIKGIQTTLSKIISNIDFKSAVDTGVNAAIMVVKEYIKAYAPVAAVLPAPPESISSKLVYELSLVNHIFSNLGPLGALRCNTILSILPIMGRLKGLIRKTITVANNQLPLANRILGPRINDLVRYGEYSIIMILAVKLSGDQLNINTIITKFTRIYQLLNDGNTAINAPAVLPPELASKLFPIAAAVHPTKSIEISSILFYNSYNPMVDDTNDELTVLVSGMTVVNSILNDLSYSDIILTTTVAYKIIKPVLTLINDNNSFDPEESLNKILGFIPNGVTVVEPVSVKESQVVIDEVTRQVGLVAAPGGGAAAAVQAVQAAVQAVAAQPPIPIRDYIEAHKSINDLNKILNSRLTFNGLPANTPILTIISATILHLKFTDNNMNHIFNIAKSECAYKMDTSLLKITSAASIAGIGYFKVPDVALELHIRYPTNGGINGLASEATVVATAGAGSIIVATTALVNGTVPAVINTLADEEQGKLQNHILAVRNRLPTLDMYPFFENTIDIATTTVNDLITDDVQSLDLAIIAGMSVIGSMAIVNPAAAGGVVIDRIWQLIVPAVANRNPGGVLDQTIIESRTIAIELFKLGYTPEIAIISGTAATILGGLNAQDDLRIIRIGVIHVGLLMKLTNEEATFVGDIVIEIIRLNNAAPPLIAKITTVALDLYRTRLSGNNIFYGLDLLETNNFIAKSIYNEILNTLPGIPPPAGALPVPPPDVIDPIKRLIDNKFSVDSCDVSSTNIYSNMVNISDNITINFSDSLYSLIYVPTNFKIKNIYNLFKIYYEIIFKEFIPVPGAAPPVAPGAPPGPGSLAYFYNLIKNDFKSQNTSISEEKIINTLVIKILHTAIINNFDDILNSTLTTVANTLINNKLNEKGIMDKFEEVDESKILEILKRKETRKTIRRDNLKQNFYLDENYMSSEPIDVISCLNNNINIIKLLKKRMKIRVKEYQSLIFKLGIKEILVELNKITNNKITIIDLTRYLEENKNKFIKACEFFHIQLKDELEQKELQFFLDDTVDVNVPTSELNLEKDVPIILSMDKETPSLGVPAAAPPTGVPWDYRLRFKDIYDDLIQNQAKSNIFLFEKIRVKLEYVFEYILVPEITEFLQFFADEQLSDIITYDNLKENLKPIIGDIINYHLNVDPMKTKEPISLENTLSKFGDLVIGLLKLETDKQNIPVIYNDRLKIKLFDFVTLISKYYHNIYRNYLKFIFNQYRYSQLL